MSSLVCLLRKLAAGAILAAFLFGAGWFCRGYYSGYYKQKAAARQAVRIMEDVKSVSEKFAPVKKSIPVSDQESGPAVTRALDGLRDTSAGPQGR